MIEQEKRKLIKETADSFLNQGGNKTNPYKKTSSKAGMHEVEAKDWAKTSKLLSTAQTLKEEETKLKNKLRKLQEYKRAVKKQLLKRIK